MRRQIRRVGRHPEIQSLAVRHRKEVLYGDAVYHAGQCCIIYVKVQLKTSLTKEQSAILTKKRRLMRVFHSPRRSKGTSGRSLSAWQATAQLVPLVLPHVIQTFGRPRSAVCL